MERLIIACIICALPGRIVLECSYTVVYVGMFTDLFLQQYVIGLILHRPILMKALLFHDVYVQLITALLFHDVYVQLITLTVLFLMQIN